MLSTGTNDTKTVHGRVDLLEAWTNRVRAVFPPFARNCYNQDAVMRGREDRAMNIRKISQHTIW